MGCTNCELPIEGNRYDNAITIDRRGWREEVLHFGCVDDPTQLHPEQFQKWTAWRMKHEREEREAHQEKVDADLKVIHRARHAFPHNLNHEYIDELYGAPEPSRLAGVPPVRYCAACERPLFCSGELDRNCRPVMVGHSHGCPTRRAA